MTIRKRDLCSRRDVLKEAETRTGILRPCLGGQDTGSERIAHRPDDPHGRRRNRPRRPKRSGAVSDYRYQALQELADQQVRFAPPQRRLEQLKRAERLLTEIDPHKDYPYQFICYRVTDFRPDAYPDLLVRGQALVHDLCALITELSGSLPAVPADELAEPVLTL